MKAREATKQPERVAGSSTKTHEGPPCAARNGPPCPLVADPEQALVVALARAVAACRAAGQDHAARVAWRALGELLAHPAAGGTKIASLDRRRHPQDDPAGGAK